MTKLAPENFHGNSSDSAVVGSSLSESVQSNMTLKDIATIIAVAKPKDVCIIDKDGYIACGPIVGTPRPEEKPIEILPKPIEPLDPPKSKCPEFYEIPRLPFEPKEPPSSKYPSPCDPRPLPYVPDESPIDKYPTKLETPKHFQK